MLDVVIPNKDDDTNKLIRSIKIPCRIHEIKEGSVSQARNIGLRKSKSKRILFIDADCWFNDGTLEEMLKHDEQIITPTIYFENGVLKHPNRLSVINGHFPADGSCFLIEKEVFDIVGLFNEKMNIMQEDREFFYRCYSNNISYKIITNKLLHSIKEKVSMKRFYFKIRNEMWLYKEYGNRFFPQGENYFLRLLKIFTINCILNRSIRRMDKSKRLSLGEGRYGYFLKAVKNGLRGHL